MRQIALQPRWADQMLCSQPSQCLTMKVVTGVAHFLPQEWFVPNTRGEQGGTANFGLDRLGGKTMTGFAMPGWSQPRSIIFLVPLLPSTAGLLLSWRLFERNMKTCFEPSVTNLHEVWHWNFLECLTHLQPFSCVLIGQSHGWLDWIVRWSEFVPWRP